MSVKLNWVLSIVATIIAIGYCMIGDAHAGPRLDQLFQPEMVNAKLSYVESIIGNPTHEHESNNIRTFDYIVEGCTVYIYADNKPNPNVLGFALNLSRRCFIKLDKFLAGQEINTQDLSLAKLGNEITGIGGDKFLSDCFLICGNAVEPTVHFTFDGPHAMNFIHIVLTITIASPASIDAASRLSSIMTDGEDADYVTFAKFNCDDKYLEPAEMAFDAVPINRITFGYDPYSSYTLDSCKDSK